MTLDMCKVFGVNAKGLSIRTSTLAVQNVFSFSNLVLSDILSNTDLRDGLQHFKDDNCHSLRALNVISTPNLTIILIW